MEFNPSAYQSKIVPAEIRRNDNVWKSLISPKPINNTNQIPSQVKLERKVVDLTYNDGYYTGTVKGQMRDGYGLFFFKNKSVYQGQFQDDKMTGVGTFHHQNRFYKGDFVEGKFTFGEVFENNRLVFEGSRGDDSYGIFYYPDNKTIYHGHLHNDVPQGVGVMTYTFRPNEAYVFRGDFENRMNVGPGELEYPNGAKYNGEFEHVLDSVPMPSGNGTLTYSTGETFVGSFEDGLPQAGQIVVDNTIYHGKFEYITFKSAFKKLDDHVLANSSGIRQGICFEGAFEVEEQKRAADEELSEATKKQKLI